MRVLAVSAGSWGDVLPFVGPVIELDRRGHEVVFALPPQFARQLRRRGLPAARVGPFVRKDALLGLFASIDADLTGRTALARYWSDMVVADTEETLRDLEALDGSFDVVLSHYHSIAALVFASRRSVPRVNLAWGPACVPSAGYAPPIGSMTVDDLVGTVAAGAGAANQRLWQAELAWCRSELDPTTNKLLETLGAEPVDGAPFSLPARCEQLLLASHQCVFPNQQDWPEHASQIGYPYEDAIPGTSAEAAIAFANAGDPPVLVSFGTAVAGGTVSTYQTVAEALVEAGYRTLLLGPNAGLRLPADRALNVTFAPLSALAPHCKGVVHHGGPGSTTATMAAAVPAVVIPRFLDQPFNAAVIAATGCGVCVRPAELDTRRLVAAVDAAMAGRGALASAAAALAASPDPAVVIADAVERYA